MDKTDLKTYPVWPEIEKMLMNSVSVKVIVKYLKTKNDFMIIKPRILSGILKECIADFTPEQKANMKTNLQAQRKRDLQDKPDAIQLSPSVFQAIILTNQMPEIIELQKVVDNQFVRILNLIGQENDKNERATKALEQAVNQTISAIIEKFRIRKEILGVADEKENPADGKNKPASQGVLRIDKFLFNIQNMAPDAQKELQNKLLPILQKAKMKKIEEGKKVAEG